MTRSALQSWNWQHMYEGHPKKVSGLDILDNNIFHNQWNIHSSLTRMSVMWIWRHC